MFDDLEQLLKGAVSHANQTQTIAKARKTAVTARPGSAEFEEANQYVKQWERENHWRFSHAEVLVVRDVCTCGMVHETVQGLFAVFQHVHHSDRIDKRSWSSPAELLESCQSKRTFVHETQVEICASCYQSRGFPNAQA